MPATVPCNPCCSVPTVVAVPGTTGSNGINSFSITDASTGGFTVPAVNGSVTVAISALAPATWMINGQTVFIANAGYYSVANAANPLSVSLTNLGYPGNAANPTIIAAGQKISPAGPIGPITVPVPIASGGTDATSKAAAQSNLGLGQAAVIGTTTGLTQAITTGYLQIGAMAIAIPVAGSWLIWGWAQVLYAGVSFAGLQTINVKLRNVTQAADISGAIIGINSPAQTTTGYPDQIYTTPPVLVSGFNAADSVEAFIERTTATNTAGTFQVVGGMIIAIPLNLT